MNRGKIPVSKKSLLNKEGFFFSVRETLFINQNISNKKM